MSVFWPYGRSFGLQLSARSECLRSMLRSWMCTLFVRHGIHSFFHSFASRSLRSTLRFSVSDHFALDSPIHTLRSLVELTSLHLQPLIHIPSSTDITRGEQTACPANFSHSTTPPTIPKLIVLLHDVNPHPLLETQLVRVLCVERVQGVDTVQYILCAWWIRRWLWYRWWIHLCAVLGLVVRSE